MLFCGSTQFNKKKKKQRVKKQEKKLCFINRSDRAVITYNLVPKVRLLDFIFTIKVFLYHVEKLRHAVEVLFSYLSITEGLKFFIATKTGASMVRPT